MKTKSKKSAETISPIYKVILPAVAFVAIYLMLVIQPADAKSPGTSNSATAILSTAGLSPSTR